MEKTDGEEIVGAAEPIVTMDDIIKDETELTEAANAVLGNAEEQICTYDGGYQRQPLYACRTCNSENRAGICYACSIECHADHELIELYTKRHFRCDCGNDKFSTSFKCKLNEDKAPTNADNGYSQNFDGLYCSCSKPYPDPDRQADEEEVMIQCCLCEDWFHENHLSEGASEGDANVKVPPSKEYSEFNCLECTKKHPFLRQYEHLRWGASEENDHEVPPAQNSCALKKVNLSMDEESTMHGVAPFFWKEGWRSRLCKCPDCLRMYRKEGVSFIVDETDSVVYYERQNLRKNEATSFEKGTKAFLQSLPHASQVDLARGYHEMSDKLRKFLATFAQSGDVVTKKDIDEFFSQMGSNKRRKTEAS